LANRRRGKITDLLDSFPESEPGMVRTLSVMATMGSSLYLGNSLPIREWNDFAQRDVPYELVRANRGANGIDGQIASWLGATVDEEDAWGVFGDLTALYDLAAPSLLNQVLCKGRMLVVINNGGGKIFDRLPMMQSLDAGVTDIIMNEHQYGFETWAQSKLFQVHPRQMIFGRNLMLWRIVNEVRYYRSILFGHKKQQ